MTQGGVGAQLRHLVVRGMHLHVHLLRARFGIVMEPYRQPNGEGFERERNESASPFACARERCLGSSMEGRKDPHTQPPQMRTSS